MAQAPQTLTLKTNRERRDWWQSPWLRRVLMLVPAALVVLALLNGFGQRMVAAWAASPAATLSVTAPERARSGLIYAARFRVVAHTDLLAEPAGEPDHLRAPQAKRQPLRRTQASRHR